MDENDDNGFRQPCHVPAYMDEGFIAGGNFNRVLPAGLVSPCVKTYDLYKFLVVFIIITDEEDTSYSGTML